MVEQSPQILTSEEKAATVEGVCVSWQYGVERVENKIRHMTYRLARGILSLVVVKL